MSDHPGPGNVPLEMLEWVDALADQFEAAWRHQPRPAIAEFLGTETGLRRFVLLAELVKIDLAYRGRAGERPRLEDYLAAFPELFSPDGSLPDHLVLHARQVEEQHTATAA